MLSDNMDFSILAIEPNIETLPKVRENYKKVELVSLDKAVSEADVVVVLVNHKEFSADTLKVATDVLDFVHVV